MRKRTKLRPEINTSVVGSGGFREVLEAEGVDVGHIRGGFDAYFRRFSSLKPLFIAAIHTGLRRGDLVLAKGLCNRSCAARFNSRKFPKRRRKEPDCRGCKIPP